MTMVKHGASQKAPLTTTYSAEKVRIWRLLAG
jgi:hypothetical protein